MHTSSEKAVVCTASLAASKWLSLNNDGRGDRIDAHTLRSWHHRSTSFCNLSR